VKAWSFDGTYAVTARLRHRIDCEASASLFPLRFSASGTALKRGQKSEAKASQSIVAIHPLGFSFTRGADFAPMSRLRYLPEVNRYRSTSYVREAVVTRRGHRGRELPFGSEGVFSGSTCKNWMAIAPGGAAKTQAKEFDCGTIHGPVSTGRSK